MAVKIVVAGYGFMGMTHNLNILGDPSLELIAIDDRFPNFIMQILMEQPGNFNTDARYAEMVDTMHA